jgi:transcriptional regulator with XRE-family HTH domain
VKKIGRRKFSAAGFSAYAKQRGWSQEEFAYRANIDRSYTGGVERGERNLSFKKLCAIAQTLGCVVAALTRGLPVPNRD